MNPLSPEAKRARWQHLWHKLHAVRFDPLPTEEDIAQAMNGLSQRRAGESLDAWLARLRAPAASQARRFRFTPLAEIRLMAASSHRERYPLPEEQPIETPDQTFRYFVEKAGDGLKVEVEALGIAIEQYAGELIGFGTSADPHSVVVLVRLDADGKGSASVPDTEAIREALCVKPVIGRVEYEDA